MYIAVKKPQNRQTDKSPNKHRPELDGIFLRLDQTCEAWIILKFKHRDDSYTCSIASTISPSSRFSARSTIRILLCR